MLRKHIVMVGCTAPSHVYPSLGVIAELVRRGHRVSYVVGAPLASLVASTGAEVVEHPTTFPLGEAAAWPDEPAEAMRVFLDEAIAIHPLLTARFDDDRPDLVLYDIGGLGAPLLAARYGVPAVQLSPTLVAWEGYDEDMAEVMTPIKTSPSGVDYAATLSRWLADHGVSADPWEWLGHPARVLSLIPRAMQPNADRVGPHVRFVGPCLDPARPADRSWTPPSSGRPVLLVSFGTAFTDQLPVYRACVSAFAADWHVVISLGKHVPPASLGPLPSSVEVHESVPQLAVLEAASAFITHAGMGGATEALWFGVPTVAIPQAADQFGNAAQLAALGVGRHLPADSVTAESLRAAVDEVSTSASVASRLAELKAEIRGHGGVSYAADAVESVVE
ncbi:UDP glycosyl transferase [Amycolatopsis mediterranei S699]|uniref:UDP glycosyltransferase n=2 Tax=Amycolatopsis mediterranei TaxID=33910 RepID=A0A0H3CYA3_AMYMU|nr:macrolide family glycosyltransferase [Amycolatopsis mediterranei]ADJ43318.1 UDP glycosyltransferase [Amycolatopsis mediterranei U32]AEK40020.1 UDP glycosyl transferase [Amycolatopsis mediterranei S699]AFO75031.1 UDP glycosyl transferase [Amycolatopsis mediterranei S699]AGT82160.1 UDP glycosyl transferase [Amycolatopsis mediterranei RB]KDO11093.1 UDP glycosyltransferase [Amycolatopsis mediterranei]